MTAAGRQDAAGGATALELFVAITDSAALSFQARGTVSGWVFSEPFTVSIDANTPSEEKLKCESVSGTNPVTFVVLERGYDDTVPTTHGAGAPVTHVLPSTVVMDLERHVYETTEDDHTQYLNEARHADPTQHEFGSPGDEFAFGAGATAGSDIATAAAAGTGDNPAREDHVHKVGAAAINAFTMFAAGVVGIVGEVQPLGGSAAAGTASKFARVDHVHNVSDASIAYAKLSIAAGDIAGSKIADLGISTAKIAAGAVTAAKITYGPYCRAHSAGQNVSASTLTLATFATVEYDASSLFTSTSRVTIPTGGDGLYDLSAAIVWATPGGEADNRRYIAIRVNGSTLVAENSASSVVSTTTTTPVSTVYKLVATDYVEVVVEQYSAGTLSNAALAASFFAATWLRAA